jgi:hypothetical protein
LVPMLCVMCSGVCSSLCCPFRVVCCSWLPEWAQICRCPSRSQCVRCALRFRHRSLGSRVVVPDVLHDLLAWEEWFAHLKLGWKEELDRRGLGLAVGPCCAAVGSCCANGASLGLGLACTAQL